MRLFVAIGSVIVLALLAALVVPPFFDWDRFRTAFETEASRVLGQPVRVGGGTSARLLPLPSVTFFDIRVGGEEEPMLTAQSVHVNVELAPLMKGEVVIVDMTLDEPRFDIRVARDGTTNWSIRSQELSAMVSPDDVAIENIAFSQGLVRVRDERYRREILLRDLSASASARTLAGPWRADAQFTYLGQPFRLSGSTGRLQPTGSITVNAKLEPQNLPYDIGFEGPVRVSDGVPSAHGLVSVKPISSRSDADRLAFPRPDRDAALPVRFDGDAQLGTAGATISAFRAEVGAGDDPYTLVGSGQAIFGEHLSFKAIVEGQQINVERLASAEQAEPSSDATGISLPQRLNTIAGLLRRIPQFQADGSVDLTLPAVIAGDTVIRDIRLNMRPLASRNGWQIGGLNAQLPGRTELVADGELTLGEDPAWNGDLLVASRQPSGLARWLSPNVSPAIREMNGAGFSASARIRAGETVLDNLELVLDGAQLRGTFRRSVPTDAPAKLAAQLAGDRADFDQLAAIFGLLIGADTRNQDMLSVLAADQDIDLTLDVGELEMAGLAARGVIGALSARRGSLSLTDLRIDDFEGVTIDGQVELTELSDDLPSGAMKLSFEAQNPLPALQIAARRSGLFSVPQHFLTDPQLLAASQIVVEASPTGGGLQWRVQGVSGGSTIDWKHSSKSVSPRLTEHGIDSTLVVVNDNASTLLRQLGLAVTQGDFGGRAAFRGAVEGVLAEGADVQGALTLTSGFVSAAGTLNDALQGKLRVRSEIDDLDPFILLSGLVVPGFGEGMSADLSGMLSLEAQQIAFTDLDGHAGDSEFSGELSLPIAAGPRPKIRGALQLGVLSSDRLFDTVFSSGDQRNLRLLSGLDADVQLTAQRVELPLAWSSVAGDAAQARARLLVLDGDFVFEDIDARWADGRVTGRSSFGQTNMASTLGGQITLTSADAALVGALAGPPDWLSGRLSLSGNFQSSGETRDGLIRGLTGSGALTLTQGSVRGIDQWALQDILKDADTVEDDVLRDAADEIVRENVLGGRFTFAEAQASIAVASGVVRASNVRLTNDKAHIDANMSLNLVDGRAEIEAGLTYEAGREAVVAASPEATLRVIGPSNNRLIDVDTVAFSTFLGLRLSERKQREFEAQKASVLEKQRLARTARLYELKAEQRRIAEEERLRIEKLREEEQERQRLEQIRRAREALEQARIERELEEAERRAEAEAAAEAGRRAQRQEQIELLRRRAEQEAERRRTADEAELLDFRSLDGG